MVVSTLSALLLAMAMTPSPRPAARVVGNVMIPGTSIELPEDIGVRMHTNHRILLGPAMGLGPNGGMTPGQVRSFYGVPANQGHDVIVIVDAWDYPTALVDFNVERSCVPQRWRSVSAVEAARY